MHLCIHQSRGRFGSSLPDTGETFSPCAEENPPAFPPFLLLMKTRGKDIKTSISHKSTSHMFWWIPTHVPSPTISGDHTAEPYQHSSQDSVNKTTWLSLTSNALTHTGNTSEFDHVILLKDRGWILCAILITCKKLGETADGVEFVQDICRYPIFLDRFLLIADVDTEIIHLCF